MSDPESIPERDSALRKAIGSRIGSIQARRAGEYRDPDVEARLSRLRRAVLAGPGTVPAIWDDTVGLLPEECRFGDGPTAWEFAAHHAMTLYAVHQQSKSESLHKPGVSLGQAAAKLVAPEQRDTDNPIRTRFQALALAQTQAGLAYHLRSLITLLRAANEGLDYAQLAVDIRRLQDPRRADNVRLQWSRGFSRIHNSDPDETAPPSTPEGSTAEAQGDSR